MQYWVFGAYKRVDLLSKGGAQEGSDNIRDIPTSCAWLICFEFGNLQSCKQYYEPVQYGVGLVDNRPSTDKFHHIAKKNVTCYTWHVTHVTHDTRHITCDTWHMTCDVWHVTHDRWGEVNLLLKCQLPSSYGLGVKVFWRYLGKLKQILRTHWPVGKVNMTPMKWLRIDIIHFIVH